VFDLVLRNGILRAATYGRGAFEFVRPQGPSIAVNLENDLEFGTICQGPQFLALEIFNVGKSDLVITSVQRLMGSTDFSVLATPGTPVVIAAGEHLAFTVRYDPTTVGTLETATIRIVSNDPDAPVVDLSATGRRGTPRITTAVADNGNLGNVCVGAFVDRELTINNSGTCPLFVLNVTSSSADFLVPAVVSYPLVIGVGDSISLPIRFQPASFGAKAGTITVTSDDPTGAKSVAVSGTVPSGKLAVTGSTCIGGVKACCLGERTISICNVGDCDLHVTSVAFKRPSKHWKLINNPFPATLHPGSCLSVLIRYKATEKCPRACELIITSDDPATPVKTLDVMAYTVLNACGCRKCCEDCRKGCCERHSHDECCTVQSIDACCDEEGGGDENVTIEDEDEG
jgi:HYDIN/CFA65/VesB-like, Ig-like domain